MLLNIDFSSTQSILVSLFVILFLLGGIIGGYKKGFLDSVFKFIGFILALLIAYIFKDTLASIMCNYLPFLKFGGIFKNVTAINIIVYQIIAFIIIFIVASLVIDLILKLTDFINSIIKKIPIIGTLNSLLGAIIGFIESLVFLYFLCFAFKFGANFLGYEVKESLADNILDISILKNNYGETLDCFQDIFEVAKEYKNEVDKTEVNNKAIELLLKYDIVTEEQIDTLIESDKLKEN